MSKLEYILAMILGGISSALTLIKKMPKTASTEKWTKALKAASAAISEVLYDTSE